ncbi:helix-turn-helix transcriptional regulator [Myroides sp. N17-2]|uniref:helix-turn-helix domain-containing protein n=1 Tax=Myroides sp. N17-2 TaxID=2030799 RepID=UPI000EFAD94F|nr:helix-turn-helix transcriptional regulator [Myroides sp. N17-2]
MNSKSKIEKILKEPSYWIESVNGVLYDAIINYMESNNLNRTQLADELQLSKGRISQILNDGEINFSINKIIEIALKIGMYPDFTLIEKQKYLAKHTGYQNSITLFNDFSDIVLTKKTKETKVIKLNQSTLYKVVLAI